MDKTLWDAAVKEFNESLGAELEEWKEALGRALDDRAGKGTSTPIQKGTNGNGPTTHAEGSCKPGQTQKTTDCTPANASTSQEGTAGAGVSGGKESEPGTPEHVKGVLSRAMKAAGVDSITPEQGARILQMAGYKNATPQMAKMLLPPPGAVGPERPATPSRPTTPTGPYANPASAAKGIEHLARTELGGDVQLHKLHDLLGKPDMKSFHDTLKHLNEIGAISLEQHEGRHGLSPEQERTMMVRPNLRGRDEKVTSLYVRDPRLLKRATGG